MFKVHSQESLKLIQLTDCHLLANPADDLLGITTNQSLEAVVQHIAKNHQDADAILVTGDLSQDGSHESYKALEQSLEQLSFPSFWIPGNHDCAQTLAQFCANKPFATDHVLAEQWQILMLNSQVSGEVHGELSEQELDRIEQALTRYPEHHTLLALHHHPIAINSQWMDEIGLRNSQQLLDRLQSANQQVVIIFGHVHQEIDHQTPLLRALATPSTCIQFKSQSSQFALDTVQPGYRWITLHKDGRLNTDVERLDEGSFVPNLSARGY